VDGPGDRLARALVRLAVGKVTTPTLPMAGVLDRRTPMPQTEEYYAALKVPGVPVKLAQSEGEYHGNGSKPSDFICIHLYYMLSWFKKRARAVDGKATGAE
jgi:acylaminoacyl-peptidase